MRKNTIIIGVCLFVAVLILSTLTPSTKRRTTFKQQFKLTRQNVIQPELTESEKLTDEQNGDSSQEGLEQALNTESEGESKQSEQAALSVSLQRPTPENPAVISVPIPSEVKGVYTTGWIAGSTKFFPRLLKFIDETEVNSLVVDVKDDTGTLSYKSNLPLAVEIKADVKKISDMIGLMGTLRDHNIYPIARVVVFKDPHLAEARPDLAVKNKNGGLWTDNKGLKWVDPHSREVWQYTLDVAEEAVALGFKEIQFDYVRFVSDGKISECVYPFANGLSKEDVIKEFLLYAKSRLDRYGVIISADTFGLTCSVDDDLGIGQKLEKIGSVVDVLSPMVYPSHYYKGTYGIANPDRAPYETIAQSMKDAQRKLEGIPVKLRPWLQDFNLGSEYGREELMAQIKALNDAGIKDWLFWNPSCRYDSSKYNSK